MITWSCHALSVTVNHLPLSMGIKNLVLYSLIWLYLLQCIGCIGLSPQKNERLRPPLRVQARGTSSAG